MCKGETHCPQQSSILVFVCESGISVNLSAVASSCTLLARVIGTRVRTSVSIANSGFHESGGIILQMPY